MFTSWRQSQFIQINILRAILFADALQREPYQLLAGEFAIVDGVGCALIEINITGGKNSSPVLIVKRCLICLLGQLFACDLIIQLHC